MTATISRWFSGIASTFMPKQVTPPLTQQQQKVAAQASVIGSTTQVSSQIHQAQPLSDKGWFAPVSEFFRNKFYSCIKGKESKHSQEIREAYQGIGGQEVTLRASETLNVRTVTFKAENFSQKIQEAGGRFVDLVHPSSGKVFPAIEVANGMSKDFQNYLKLMGILDAANWSNSQWRYCVSNGKTYILSAADHSEIITGKYSNSKGTFRDIEVRERRADCRAQSTVILSGPIYSHFESNYTAREVGAFLVRGLNVVIFEDKNPTIFDSESVTNTGAARDAIYGHVISQPGMLPSKVIWKGTCFGAIPNVVAAAKYPGSAVIADQTFSRFSQIASQYAGQTEYGKWVPQFIRSLFVGAAASLNDCEHTLEKDLPQVKGPVCLIENDRDALIPKEMRQDLRKLLPANGVNEVIHINNTFVDHADGWYKDAHASYKIDQFLKQIGATKGSFLSAAAAA